MSPLTLLSVLWTVTWQADTSSITRRNQTSKAMPQMQPLTPRPVSVCMIAYVCCHLAGTSAEGARNQQVGETALRPCDVIRRRPVFSGSLSYWRCQHSMRSRIYVTVGCLSIRLFHRSTAATAASGFAAEGRKYQWIATGVLQMSFCRCQSWAANAGSVMLRANDGGSTWTCFNMLLEGFQSTWGRRGLRLTHLYM